VEYAKLQGELSVMKERLADAQKCMGRVNKAGLGHVMMADED